MRMRTSRKNLLKAYDFVPAEHASLFLLPTIAMKNYEYLGKRKGNLEFMKTFIDIMQYILTYFLVCTICFIHKSNFLLPMPYFIFIVNKIIFFHNDLLVLSIKLPIDPQTKI